MSDFLNLISRILMSAVFIVSGYGKLIDPTHFLAGPGPKRFMEMIGGGTPPTWIGYAIAGIEILGGIAIILGVATRVVAALFVIYLIVVTYLGHPFWITGNAGDQTNFWKNLAIMGAFLMLAINGSGAHSVDGRMSAAKQA